MALTQNDVARIRAFFRYDSDSQYLFYNTRPPATAFNSILHQSRYMDMIRDWQRFRYALKHNLNEEEEQWIPWEVLEDIPVLARAIDRHGRFIIRVPVVRAGRVHSFPLRYARAVFVVVHGFIPRGKVKLLNTLDIRGVIP